MSYIVKTGNLLAAPELRQNDKGGYYTYARIAVTDRVNEQGEWKDGPMIPFTVLVNGNPAVELAAIASESGNVRIMFAGQYRVTEYNPEEGTPRLVHNVTADEIGVSLKGQSVSVKPKK